MSSPLIQKLALTNDDDVCQAFFDVTLRLYGQDAIQAAAPSVPAFVVHCHDLMNSSMKLFNGGLDALLSMGLSTKRILPAYEAMDATHARTALESALHRSLPPGKNTPGKTGEFLRHFYSLESITLNCLAAKVRAYIFQNWSKSPKLSRLIRAELKAN